MVLNPYQTNDGMSLMDFESRMHFVQKMVRKKALQNKSYQVEQLSHLVTLACNELEKHDPAMAKEIRNILEQL